MHLELGYTWYGLVYEALDAEHDILTPLEPQPRFVDKRLEI